MNAKRSIQAQISDARMPPGVAFHAARILSFA
jgi:hypothetical protein